MKERKCQKCGQNYLFPSFRVILWQSFGYANQGVDDFNWYAYCEKCRQEIFEYKEPLPQRVVILVFTVFFVVLACLIGFGKIFAPAFFLKGLSLGLIVVLPILFVLSHLFFKRPPKG